VNAQVSIRVVKLEENMRFLEGHLILVIVGPTYRTPGRQDKSNHCCQKNGEQTPVFRHADSFCVFDRVAGHMPIGEQSFTL
jgi:hypothetical protein